MVEAVQGALQQIDPRIELSATEQSDTWGFQAGQFPAMLRFDAASGRLLLYGGMGAKLEKMERIWDHPASDQIPTISRLSKAADASGLNLNFWVAPAILYQLGGAFVPPEQKEMIQKLGPGPIGIFVGWF